MTTHCVGADVMTEKELQEKARYCRIMARVAASHDLKESWLNVAEMWL
jgi:hypothetical protein